MRALMPRPTWPVMGWDVPVPSTATKNGMGAATVPNAELQSEGEAEVRKSGWLFGKG